jgi:predicted permease
MEALLIIAVVTVGLFAARRIAVRRWLAGTLTTAQAATLVSVVMPIGLLGLAAYQRSLGVVGLVASTALFVAQFVTARYLLGTRVRSQN